LFGFGVSELALIAVIALVVFGPAKLPEMGAAVGKTIREFKKGSEEAADDAPVAAPTPPDRETKS